MQTHCRQRYCDIKDVVFEIETVGLQIIPPLVIAEDRRYLYKMVGKREILLFFMVTALISGCGDPLRDNVNDPDSNLYLQPPPANPYGSLVVTATRRTGSAISGLLVLVDNRSATTNSVGTAVVADLPVGQYTVRFLTSQFVSDSTTVTIESNDTAYWAKQLNAMPHFDSVSVTCELRPSSNPNQVAVKFLAKISDPDGSSDLPDSAATVAVAQFGTFQLGRLDASTWQYIDTTAETWSAWQLVGLPVHYSAHDQPPTTFNQGHTNSGNVTLARVFNANPIVTAPSQTTVLRSQLVVQWGPSQGDGGFTYSNRINFLSLGVQRSYSFVNIPNTVIQYSLHDSLAVGNYYLYVEEVDLFGNSSRSDLRQIQITNN